jgi:hypothetical protein
MNKKIIFFTLFLLLTGALYSQSFDPSVIKKSLVRVKVSLDASKANVCTGFVWKTPTQVVTSLHAMRPGASIQVLYLNQAWRKARIKKFLLKADLVLLEILPDEEPVPAGVVPLTSFNDQPVKFGTEIFAMGYNNGATGSSSRTLKKGYVDPENLENLIPKSDKSAITKIGFPALDLHILYLEGSLLPGYSGSPVFDPQGRLIGIGDGGLEKGASNVSWLIPSSYLTELENSPAGASLPSNFPDMTQLFSAELAEEPSHSNQERNNEQEVTADEQVLEGSYEEDYEFVEYVPLVSPDFEFWLTKNRSIDEMAESSDVPEKLYSITDYIESFNVKLDYDYLRFDIYEDINYGVILAVPESENIYYNDEIGYYQVDYIGNPNVDLFYIGGTGDYSQTDFEQMIASVLEVVPPLIQDQWAVGGFTIDQEFSSWMEIDQYRKMANILMVSEGFEDAEFGGLSNVYLYLTLLMSHDKSFMSVASFCMSEAQLNFAAVNGVDCLNYTSDDCDYFESLIKVFCAAHLTTFAY